MLRMKYELVGVGNTHATYESGYHAVVACLGPSHALSILRVLSRSTGEKFGIVSPLQLWKSVEDFQRSVETVTLAMTAETNLEPSQDRAVEQLLLMWL